MDPSMTMKFLLPLALVPVTVLTRAALVATMDLPGSMMIVSPRSSTTPLIVSIRSFGVGSLSPLQPQSLMDIRCTQVDLASLSWVQCDTRCWQTAVPAVVINAKTASNVQVLQLKALRPNLLDKVCHDDCSFPEDVHLRVSPASLYKKDWQA